MTEFAKTHLQLGKPQAVEAKSAPELRQWLQDKATENGLTWLLAFSDSGVTWGVLDKDSLSLSGDPGAFPEISPTLDPLLLQQAFLFSPQAELRLWRNETGLVFRLLKEETGGEDEYYDTDSLLWGDQADEKRLDFVLLREGEQGFLHTPPLVAQSLKGPRRLVVRNYLAVEKETGQVFVSLSRLVALK